MKWLYRAAAGRMPGGVRAGLGENFDPDPTVIRLVRVAVMLLSLGIGLIVCLIAWIVVPEKPGIQKTTVPVTGSGGQN